MNRRTLLRLGAVVASIGVGIQASSTRVTATPNARVTETIGTPAGSLKGLGSAVEGLDSPEFVTAHDLNVPESDSVDYNLFYLSMDGEVQNKFRVNYADNRGVEVNQDALFLSDQETLLRFPFEADREEKYTFPQYIRSLAWDASSDSLWVGSRTRIWKLDDTYGIAKTIVLEEIAPRESLKIAHTGSALWVQLRSSDGSEEFWKVDPSTGETVAKFSSPLDGLADVTWINDTLWGASRDGNVHQFEFTRQGTTTDDPTETSSSTTEPSQSTAADGASNQDTELQDSDGDGVIDSEDYAPEDPKVQEKSDLQTSGGGPGFGFGVASAAAMLTGLIARLRGKRE